jgi:hypothetical protein
MRAFVFGCTAALLLALIFALFLYYLQQPADIAFSRSAVRLQLPEAASAAKATDPLAVANAVAAVLMFISWLGQNIFQSEMTSKNALIQRNVQFINSERSRCRIGYSCSSRSEKRRSLIRRSS